jgi:hypothetical protein
MSSLPAADNANRRETECGHKETQSQPEPIRMATTTTTVDARTAEIAATLMDIASMTRTGHHSVSSLNSANSNNPAVWEQRAQPSTTMSSSGSVLLPGSSSSQDQVGLSPADLASEPVAALSSSSSCVGVGEDAAVTQAARAAIRDALQRGGRDNQLLLPVVTTAVSPPPARMRIQLASRLALNRRGPTTTRCGCSKNWA